MHLAPASVHLYLSRYGRRPIFFSSLVLQVVGGILAAIAPEFISFVIARMLVGATTSGVFLVAYVIGKILHFVLCFHFMHTSTFKILLLSFNFLAALEMVGSSKRLIAGTVCQMFFSFGYMLTALVAYLITDWRHLQIALTLPGLAFLCYWW